MSWEELENYEPQKEQDGFEPFTERNLKCAVDWARVEVDDKEKFGNEPNPNHGKEAYRYCLIVLEHPELTDRKIWSKRYYLHVPEDLKKLADIFWTVSLRFKNREELDAANDLFVKKTLKVRAWAWTPKDSSTPRQMHVIKGEATNGGDTTTPAEAPF